MAFAILAGTTNALNSQFDEIGLMPMNAHPY